MVDNPKGHRLSTTFSGSVGQFSSKLARIGRLQTDLVTVLVEVIAKLLCNKI